MCIRDSICDGGQSAIEWCKDHWKFIATVALVAIAVVLLCTGCLLYTSGQITTSLKHLALKLKTMLSLQTLLTLTLKQSEIQLFLHSFVRLSPPARLWGASVRGPPSRGVAAVRPPGRWRR